MKSIFTIQKHYVWWKRGEIICRVVWESSWKVFGGISVRRAGFGAGDIIGLRESNECSPK